MMEEDPICLSGHNSCRSKHLGRTGECFTSNAQRKVLSFVIAVFISGCMASHFPYRRTMFKSLRYLSPAFGKYSLLSPITTPPIPGTTPNIMHLDEEDDKQASEKGVKVPLNGECVITWDQFKEHISGRNLIDIYGIDEDIFPGTRFKLSVIWYAVNQTMVRRIGSFWNSATKNCNFVDNMFNRVDDNLAIFQPMGSDSIRVFFMSSQPDRYIIIHVCFTVMDIIDGRCSKTLTHIMVRDQRDGPVNSEGVHEQPIRLNDIPWTQLERDSKTCLGQMITDDSDPQIFWAWTTPDNSECAMPGTDAFDKKLSE